MPNVLAEESAVDEQLTASVQEALSKNNTPDAKDSGADNSSSGTNSQNTKSEVDDQSSKDGEVKDQKASRDNLEERVQQIQQKLDEESQKRQEVEKQYKELLAEFTRRSQKLARLEKLAEKVEQVQDKVGENQPSSTLTPEERQVVEQLKKYGVVLQSDVKSLLDNLKSEIDNIKTELKDLPAKAASTAITTAELKQELAEIEAVYDGSKDEDGIQKPKVDVNQVLDFIAKNPNINKKPSEIARMLFADEFIRYEAQKRLASQKSQSSLPKTESSSGTVNKKPDKDNVVLDFDNGSVDQALDNIIGQLSKS